MTSDKTTSKSRSFLFAVLFAKTDGELVCASLIKVQILEVQLQPCWFALDLFDNDEPHQQLFDDCPQSIIQPEHFVAATNLGLQAIFGGVVRNCCRTERQDGRISTCLGAPVAHCGVRNQCGSPVVGGLFT